MAAKQDAAKRRAYRGYTFDPWPCCGAVGENWGGGQRPKDQAVCPSCQDLIEAGKAARAAAEGQQLQTYHWVEVYYAVPNYYGDYRFPNGELHARLEKAIFNIVASVAVVAPADHPRESPEVIGEKPDFFDKRKKVPVFKEWPDVLKAQSNNVRRDWPQMVLMPKAARDAINNLDQVIRDLIPAMYQEGKEQGGSLLLALASGEKTTADFEAGMADKRLKKSREGQAHFRVADDEDEDE